MCIRDRLKRIIAFGNCDAASALLLHRPLAVDALIALQLRRGAPKRRNGSADVGAAAFKTAVDALGVADAAPVETENGVACIVYARRPRRHAAIRPAADFIATRHDQQPGRPRRFVKARGERGAVTGKAQLMLSLIHS